jgi:hypothetical protein
MAASFKRRLVRRISESNMSFTIKNGWSNSMWKKAVRNGGALVCGVVISNITDPTVPIYSKAWFFHVMLSSVTTFIVTELTYYRNWLAQSADETPKPPMNPPAMIFLGILIGTAINLAGKFFLQ